MRLTLALLSVLVLTACSQGQDNRDLRAFMDKELKKPARSIPPLPVFKPYEAFSYKAATNRSPFESSKDELKRIQLTQVGSGVTPDSARAKEPLEEFSLGELSMVGSLKKSSGELNALIQVDGNGVYRLKNGGYMGKNHGRVVNLTTSQIDLIEIVPDGAGGWIERPRTMVLKGAGTAGEQ